jgi:polyvinyl alcohol dehydrogenase (cytochrome)
MQTETVQIRRTARRAAARGRRRRAAAGLAGLIAAAAALAGCSSAPAPSGHATASRQVTSPAPTSPAPTSSPSSGAAAVVDWPTYHQNPQRTGVAPGMPAAGPLQLAWSANLGGEVAGQPIIVGDTVVAATEHDTVFGLSRGNGAVLWRTSLGTPVPLSEQPCGNLNPLGITSTPVYDPATGLVYVVAQDGRTSHVLAGLRLSDGRVAFTRDIPAPDHEPAYDQQRGALALADGHVYVVFGGHFGDCGPYIGSVVAVPATGSGPLYSYRVPTPKQGGIWAAGGPVVSPDGTIFVSSGNGGRFKPPYDGSDSVIALTPGLRRTGVFAPSNWASLSASDLDLGSTSPALLSDGQILQVGKSGVAYLVDGAHLGGVGGQLADQKVCVAFGGAAVSGTTVYVPCVTGGVTAVDTAGSRIKISWRSPAAVSGSPVLGGGALWVSAPGDGVLYEVDPATGAVREQLTIARLLPDFASPSLSGDLVLVGTDTGVVAVSGA